jgi:hypothetical protein
MTPVTAADIPRLIEVHYHDAGDGLEECACDQPGTYARQAPNPLDATTMNGRLFYLPGEE